ncbi:hypothetical protein CON07_25785 [Bacillus sp. AFS094611]|uniref:Uncharacterized protein n=2 Tax=Bacillus cereus group TaxID=86661 RepID=A0A2A7D427_BACAN|nr:hypothetical protein CON16_23815 [Bacillus anthracis]PDZ48621.1 hypothetical protein CON07_25785 [Bacillus sp. AFS094611]PEJ00764.1 hypothetical protein CN684_30205 [Bacillus wiedmannii]PEM23371.1 hypothetical protein CN617_28090 [Bacillus wiedmannii]PHC62363.1 hypothetical protein COF35_29920 [Bacillus wiedmannii]
MINLKEISINEKGEVEESLRLPTNRFPETAESIKDSIANGKTDICRIDHNGVQNEENKL